MSLTRQETTSSENDEVVFELAPPPSAQVLEQLQTFLRRDFCKPQQDEAALGSSEDQYYHTYAHGLESIIHVHPLGNLKKVLNGFCDPEELMKREERCSRSLMTRSYDSDDTKEHILEEEEDDFGVLVTHPGVSRASRVYQGLGTFVCAIIILLATFHILARCGLSIELELRQKGVDEDTSPVSFSQPSSTGRWAH